MVHIYPSVLKYCSVLSSILTTMSVMQDPLAGPSALRDIIKPQFHQVNLSAEFYIKRELGIKLDKGRSPTFKDSLGRYSLTIPNR